ncbi:MAG: DNA alkylation repair protein [Candidatus Thorarchaeota archaeon]|nr:DNA alkylation repair protein [Candidatus Thorarchaeota archaeon]MCK5240413.1 DNA alkylation repair protein [Candidatus Thorarchaeota archaeon]
MSSFRKKALLDDLHAVGNMEQARISAGYLKTSELSFIGIKLPIIAKIVKKHMRSLSFDELKDLMIDLWNELYYEARRASIDIMKEFVKKADVEIAFKIIDSWIDDIDTWALMDPLGSNCLGELLMRNPELEKIFISWSTDDNFWRRRATILPYLYLSLKRNYRPEFNSRVLKAVKPHISDKEFFVGKAAGWVLRELSKRDPDVVREFFENNRSKMTSLVIREGSMKLKG